MKDSQYLQAIMPARAETHAGGMAFHRFSRPSLMINRDIFQTAAVAGLMKALGLAGLDCIETQRWHSSVVLPAVAERQKRLISTLPSPDAANAGWVTKAGQQTHSRAPHTPIAVVHHPIRGYSTLPGRGQDFNTIQYAGNLGCFARLLVCSRDR